MRILFVDAGNYCRSPAAEAVARSMIERAGLTSQLQVGSAGLKDKHVGGGADPRTVQACATRGYDLANFRCREIAAADFVHTDLILAMDRENLAQLEARRPDTARARLGLFLEDTEVPDPYFGAADGFESMMDLIESGVSRLIGRLAPGRERGTSRR